MQVVLIGYRGSGKTTVGRLLARRLGQGFVDVDDEICRRFGIDSIADIWRRHGEAAFRAVEVEVTRDLCGRSNVVLALGGGTVMQAAAREAMEQATGVMRVYLRCDPSRLYERISADERSAATRPSLTPLGGGLEEVRQVLRDREPVYLAVADRVLEVTDLSPQEVVERLLSWLAEGAGSA